MAILHQFPHSTSSFGGSFAPPDAPLEAESLDCIKCGNSFDVDQRGDFKEVSGLPAYMDDPAIICWECKSLYCKVCDEDVLQPDGRDLCVRDGVRWINGNPFCCEAGCDDEPPMDAFDEAYARASARGWSD